MSRILPCCIAMALLAQDGPPLPSDTAATVNGEAITAAQLDKTLRPQIQAMEDRLRQLRQGTLNKMIDNLLLEQAARKEGINVDQLLSARVESVTVPSQEVDRAYEESREQFPGMLAAEAKYRIRRTMEDNARAAALKNLIAKLREQAQITNVLTSSARAMLEAAAYEGPSAGNPGAPVTIIEFSDFECPFCRQAQPVLKRMMERWPGKVRLVFKHFPLEQHRHAMQAARVAVCASLQDRFWAVHDRIFASTELNQAVLREAVAGANLRIAEFESCIGSEEPDGHVRKDMLLGRTAGVAGTPAFFVNGELVPASSLESTVEKILGGAQ